MPTTSILRLYKQVVLFRVDNSWKSWLVIALSWFPFISLYQCIITVWDYYVTYADKSTISVPLMSEFKGYIYTFKFCQMCKIYTYLSIFQWKIRTLIYLKKTILISRMNGYFSLVVLLKLFFETSSRDYADACVLRILRIFRHS